MKYKNSTQEYKKKKIPVGAKFSAPVQIGPEAHPVSNTTSTGSFPGVKAAKAWS
jgi:hypothetical protein